MNPALSLRNLTPSSRAAASLPFGPGVVVIVHRLHGHEGAATVVNDQATSAATGLPARSLTPVLPPLTVTV